MKEKTKRNKYKLFLIGFVFAIMGCSPGVVEVEQPVVTTEAYVINAHDFFYNMVNKIAWRKEHIHFGARQDDTGAVDSRVELGVVHAWEFLEDEDLTDLVGDFTYNLYIQKGQEESLRFATLSPKHRRGEENRIYYSQGHWGIQNSGTGIKFVFHRHGGDLHIGGAWSSANNIFERLTDYFRSDIIEMFGDDIILLNNLYKLSPLENKEEIINSVHETQALPRKSSLD